MPASSRPIANLQGLAPTRDSDPAETSDWLDSLESMFRHSGPERAEFILSALEHKARELGVYSDVLPFSPYRNTIPLEKQSRFPGDLAMETRITAIMRWNALAMVVRANKAYGELGGHVASYASAAEIFELGFNHFFRAADDGDGGDLLYFQPHSAPGVYARAFLEGRLDEQRLDRYRREIGGAGLSSYPHPWLMPDFWQTPTGSMGIGPISAVYQARFMRYLRDRGLAETDGRRVWGVFGDGEMDEPESLAGLSLAAREKLDNLTFIINCNLQRLDGPVRGNGQIIQELEMIFRGAGWNVIKVLWGTEWDVLFARDVNHALLRRFAATVDGKYQKLGAEDGAYNLTHFFDEDPEVRALVAHMSDRDVDALKRGGHDFRKLYAAFELAKATKGQPTVILAKTKKGFGMGGAGESRMTAHQTKKLDIEALRAFRDRFALPLSDEQVERLDFYRPSDNSAELVYMRERRRALGGYLPARRRSAPAVAVPPLASYADFALHPEGKAMSTTMAAVRLFSNLLRDRTLGPRIVPIVADEARTFGMANLFRQVGIYAPFGQAYEPEDFRLDALLQGNEGRSAARRGHHRSGSDLFMDRGGDILQRAWPGDASLLHLLLDVRVPARRRPDLGRGRPAGARLPDRGHRRAHDARRRGPATPGRRQPSDRRHHSELPRLRPRLRLRNGCDPRPRGPLDDGGGPGRVLLRHRDERELRAAVDAVWRGSRHRQGPLPLRLTCRRKQPRIGSPAGFRRHPSGSVEAARILATDWNVSSEVWSATSYAELAREAREAERHNRLESAG